MSHLVLDGSGEDAETATQHYLAQLAAEDNVEAKCVRLFICWVDRTCSETTRRLQIATRRNEDRVLLANTLSELDNVERKFGRAPSSFMERAAQQWLESFLEIDR